MHLSISTTTSRNLPKISPQSELCTTVARSNLTGQTLNASSQNWVLSPYSTLQCQTDVQCCMESRSWDHARRTSGSNKSVRNITSRNVNVFQLNALRRTISETLSSLLFSSPSRACHCNWVHEQGVSVKILESHRGSSSVVRLLRSTPTYSTLYTKLLSKTCRKWLYVSQ